MSPLADDDALQPPAERLLNSRAIDDDEPLPAPGLLEGPLAPGMRLGGYELLDEADQLSREALSAAPAVSAFRGTRGAVLLQKGDLPQSRKLLLQAYRRQSDRRSRAKDAALLAIACARLRDVPEAHRWLARARSEAADDLLVGLAEREIAPLTGVAG